ncbi:unnamed protein product [Schistosoma mattheei]|uniref:Uncharacterized protein n=1 Tax=Schistosoma mattheei TaxID=31246 RepID=A0A183Q7W1_9TREM|nr:unnamed protein product [Schistosoma mattheei]
MRCPSFQSIGTCSSSQIFFNRRYIMLVAAFSASAGMLSGPAAFPFLICLTAILLSPVVGGLTSIGRSMCAASMSVGFIGAGLFRSSSKYSTHLLRCC